MVLQYQGTLVTIDRSRRSVKGYLYNQARLSDTNHVVAEGHPDEQESLQRYQAIATKLVRDIHVTIL